MALRVSACVLQFGTTSTQRRHRAEPQSKVVEAHGSVGNEA